MEQSSFAGSYHSSFTFVGQNSLTLALASVVLTDRSSDVDCMMGSQNLRNDAGSFSITKLTRCKEQLFQRFRAVIHLLYGYRLPH